MKNVSAGAHEPTKDLREKFPEPQLSQPPMNKCLPLLLKSLHQKITMEERAEPLALDEEPAVAVARDAGPKDDWSLLDAGPFSHSCSN